MFEQDVKIAFIVWNKRYVKCEWVKTGAKLGTGEYSPIITQFPNYLLQR
jgi:hypothetical protein